MNLLSILCKSLLSDGALSALAKKTGLSVSKLAKLIPLALPLLLKALTSNASSESGALSLLDALTQHTDKKAVDRQIAEADETDGGKILAHIFGDRSDAVYGSLAAQTGMKEQEVSCALSNLTPALLSGLSAATGSAKPKPGSGGQKFDLSDGLDLGDVMAIFGGGAPAAPTTGGLLSGLFGGGKPEGGGLLGSLFGSDGAEEKDDSLNGTALLSALLSAGR